MTMARNKSDRLALAARAAYIGRMVLRKTAEIPPEAAKAFVRDLRAFFAAPNQLKQDEIAARQLSALRPFQGPREKKIRLADVKQMFLAMRDHV